MTSTENGKCKVDIGNFSRALIIRSGSLGDFILTLPAIQALREACPGAHIEIIGRPSVIEIAHKRHYADEIRSVDRSDFAPLFAQDGEPSREVAAYLAGFDMLLSYLPDRDRVFQRSIQRIGIQRLLWGGVGPGAKNGRHVVDILSEPVSNAGIAVRDRTPRLYTNNDDHREAESFLVGNGIGASDPFFVVHPGSGGSRKCWFPHRFAQTADELARETGSKVVVPTGPADDDATERMVSAMETKPVVAGGLSLPVLSGLIGRCRAYIGNDSGVSHLAAASGAPVVALFGPTDPRVWGPRGSRVRIVQGDPDLVPERRLMGVRTEEVVRAVLEVWKSTENEDAIQHGSRS